jgi:voltage-gated potassium channel
MQSTPELLNLPIQLLSRKYPSGLPPELSEQGILLRSGSAEDGQIIHKINLDKAKYIVLLARDCQNSTSDSVTFDILHQVLEINTQANIIVEAVLDENRHRFLKMGATAVIRPIRAYPEIVVRALTNPGTERVLEDLFHAHGDSIQRVECRFNNVAWSEILKRCIVEKLGTPLAYFNGKQLEVQPDFDKCCSGDALAILTKEGRASELHKLRALFD